MSVLYCNQDEGSLYKINSNIEYPTITVNNPITVEYKKIRIVSNDFSKFIDNKIMVVNNIKNTETKDVANDDITYFDENAKYQKLDGKDYYDINEFDAAKYGNPICYYCPSYNSEVITITTKFYKLKFDTPVDKVLNYMQSILSVGSLIPNYSVYFSVAQDSVSELASIISDLNDGIDLLVPHHTFQLRNDDKNQPLLVGNYLCLPDVTDDNTLNIIMNNYTINNYKLIGKTITGEIVEYMGSYFILHVDNQQRPDLNDFDFVSSSNSLLKALKNGEQDALDKIISAMTDSSNLTFIKNIINEYKSNPTSFTGIQNMFNLLSTDAQSWFSTSFPQIISKFTTS